MKENMVLTHKCINCGESTEAKVTLITEMLEMVSVIECENCGSHNKAYGWLWNMHPKGTLVVAGLDVIREELPEN